jgi:flagellar motor switch protein FliM
MKDLLSQDEVDALLAAVQDDASAPTLQTELPTFDLARRRKCKKQRLPGMEHLVDCFAEAFQDGLSRLFGCEVGVGVVELQFQTCAEYLHSLYVPTSLNMMRIQPLDGSAMLVLDAQLVFRLVEIFFGGRTAVSSGTARNFTLAERRIIGRVISLAHATFEDVTRNIAELECEPAGSEINPSLVSLAAAAETIVVCRFQIDAEGGGGEFHISIPLKMLEPVRERLARSEGGYYRSGDDEWRQAIAESVMDTPLATRFLLGERSVNLQEIAGLQIGDVLPLQLDGAALCAAGLPVASMAVDYRRDDASGKPVLRLRINKS